MRPRALSASRNSLPRAPWRSQAVVGGHAQSRSSQALRRFRPRNSSSRNLREDSSNRLHAPAEQLLRADEESLGRQPAIKTLLRPPCAAATPDEARRRQDTVVRPPSTAARSQPVRPARCRSTWSICMHRLAMVFELQSAARKKIRPSAGHGCSAYPTSDLAGALGNYPAWPKRSVARAPPSALFGALSSFRACSRGRVGV